MIPGIVGDYFPKPDKDPKKDTDNKIAKPLVPIKTDPLYLHHIEVVGSQRVEDQICKTLAQMFCDKKMSGTGMK